MGSGGRRRFDGLGKKWLRDIVDTSTHAFCVSGRVGIKGAGVSTMWKEG
jgi:hypothetical protein